MTRMLQNLAGRLSPAWAAPGLVAIGVVALGVTAKGQQQPTASLTVQIFTYASSPYDDWHRQAWAGALVLVSIVLICSMLARAATRGLERMNTGG